MSTKVKKPKAERCGECGAAVQPAEFHPYLFCLLKKAEPACNPWVQFKWAVERLGYGPLPVKSPLLSELPLAREDSPTDLERGTDG